MDNILYSDHRCRKSVDDAKWTRLENCGDLYGWTKYVIYYTTYLRLHVPTFSVHNSNAEFICVIILRANEGLMGY